MNLCVFGGTGATGSNVIRVARTKGYDVIALARRPEVLTTQFPDIKVVPGDVFKPETISGVRSCVVSIHLSLDYLFVG